MLPGDLGFVVSVSRTTADVRLFASGTEMDGHLSLGQLIAIPLGTSLVVGTVDKVRMSAPPDGVAVAGMVLASVEFLGEIRHHGGSDAFFQRGMIAYPAIGDKARALAREDLRVIHHVGGRTIEVGTLQLDETIPAYIDFDELLSKHFAVLGSTGVGKSTGVALILQEILRKKANLRILLIDPHSEYAACFGDQAEVIGPHTLRLPFWLFNFEEIVDVYFRGRPGVEDEIEISLGTDSDRESRLRGQCRGRARARAPAEIRLRAVHGGHASPLSRFRSCQPHQEPHGGT